MQVLKERFGFDGIKAFNIGLNLLKAADRQEADALDLLEKLLPEEPQR